MVIIVSSQSCLSVTQGECPVGHSKKFEVKGRGIAWYVSAKDAQEHKDLVRFSPSERNNVHHFLMYCCVYVLK
jgi:hypothetical protein